jgi:hypothetical protein
MPVRIFAGDKIFTIDPPSPAIIAGIECFIVTKAGRKFTVNSQSQDALPKMPCPGRPGCLDNISSFDNADMVRHNVYSTEIVQIGSKIAGSKIT